MTASWSLPLDDCRQVKKNRLEWEQWTVADLESEEVNEVTASRRQRTLSNLS